MSVSIDAFGLTDQGKVRPSNQDNFLIVEVNKTVKVQHSSLSPAAMSTRFPGVSGHLFVVADGVGGGPEGDRASEDTIAAVLKYVGEAVGCFNSSSTTKEHQLFERLEDTVRDVHESLLNDASLHKQAPATTLTMVLLIWPRAYHVHVGDSRAYVRRGDKLQQLTRDQTFSEYMLSLGAWTEEQAKISRPGATLTSAVGGPQFEPVVGLIDLEPGDSLLMCTDGLSKHVPDDRIAAVLAGDGNSESMARKLLDAALDAGGTDNISIIVARTE